MSISTPQSHDEQNYNMATLKSIVNWIKTQYTDGSLQYNQSR